MLYKSFRIRNYKGIHDTTVDVDSSSGARIFPFVGLNESGKTTILEAIHSFSPDYHTKLVSETRAGKPISAVPRHLYAHFTGNVSVTATLVLDQADKQFVSDRCKADGIIVQNIPDEVIIERGTSYQDGDAGNTYFEIKNAVLVRTVTSKKFHQPTTEERAAIAQICWYKTPDIAYFPTFVFDFPEKIYLTRDGSGVNPFYRQLFQDILDYGKEGLSIDKNITRRIHSEAYQISWSSFLEKWSQSEDSRKIQHIMDKASSRATDVVFSSWNDIFKDDTGGKQLEIISGVSDRSKSEDSNVENLFQHDLWIKFQVRDGSRRFEVRDRSLGFRWFFAFMMFTQFRAARDVNRSTVFLFDEPASNLHAAAQQKLIESFPEVVKGKHLLLYTTHSHHMIEPKWLEQTFIVSNKSDTSIAASGSTLSSKDESLDIRATRYRNFVNENPANTTYFQPILDRLDVVPSKFDFKKGSIILEGRSDYYILRYAQLAFKLQELPLVPGLGAGTFGALVALQIGWGMRALFVLDADKQGKLEKARYIREFGLNQANAVVLSELMPNINVIEDLVDGDAKDKIRTLSCLDASPGKKDILKFFQERLNSSVLPSLGAGFEKNATELIAKLRSRVSEL